MKSLPNHLVPESRRELSVLVLVGPLEALNSRLHVVEGIERWWGGFVNPARSHHADVRGRTGGHDGGCDAFVEGNDYAPPLHDDATIVRGEHEHQGEPELIGPLTLRDSSQLRAPITTLDFSVSFPSTIPVPFHTPKPRV